MDWKKKISRAVSAALTRRYPVLWTAVIFASVPVLLRIGSSYTRGTLCFGMGDGGVRAAPLMEITVFVASLAGVLKYGSRAHVLAFALWVGTFLSVVTFGIVLFEAFSPPRQWSGSLRLPGVVAVSCGAGVVVGAGARWLSACLRRSGTGERR